MFLVALSEYDQVLVESDNEVSQREEPCRGVVGKEGCLCAFWEGGNKVLG